MNHNKSEHNIYIYKCRACKFGCCLYTDLIAHIISDSHKKNIYSRYNNDIINNEKYLLRYDVPFKINDTDIINNINISLSKFNDFYQ